MKSMLIALSLVTSAVFAGDIVPAENAKDAVAQVAQKCTQGCLVLSPQEVEQIQNNIAAAIQAAQQKAYEVGKNVCNKTI